MIGWLRNLESANPLSMTAGLAAMQALDQSAFAHLEARGDALRARLTNSIEGRQAPFCVAGAASLFRIHTKRRKPTDFREAFASPAEAGVMRELSRFFAGQGIIIPKRDKCIVMHSDDDGRHELRRRCVRSLPRNPVGKLREPDVMKRVADSNLATPTNYFNGLERIENWLSLALPTIGFPFRDPIASAAVLGRFGVVATADRSPASPTATPRNPAVSRSSWPARATSRTYAEECEASRLHLDPSSTAWLARFGLTGRRGHSIRQAPRGRQAQWCLP